MTVNSSTPQGKGRGLGRWKRGGRHNYDTGFVSDGKVFNGTGQAILSRVQKFEPSIPILAKPPAKPVVVCILCKNAGREDGHSSMVCPFAGDSEFLKPVEIHPITCRNIKSIHSLHSIPKKVSAPPVTVSSKVKNSKTKEKHWWGSIFCNIYNTQTQGQQHPVQTRGSQKMQIHHRYPFKQIKGKGFLILLCPTDILAPHQSQL
jgi:hypothetical protein